MAWGSPSCFLPNTVYETGSSSLNDWLERWSAEVTDQRVHGTTHKRPTDRFTHEQLTPLSTRPPYHYEQVQSRRVANDALVTIGAARYSVPVAYVGQTVCVQESTTHYEIFHRTRLIARHQKAARYSVMMDPAHYAGLCGPAANRPQLS